MANPSLSEYLSQSQKGLYQSVFGPEYLQKQTYHTVDTSTGIFNYIRCFREVSLHSTARRWCRGCFGS